MSFTSLKFRPTPEKSVSFAFDIKVLVPDYIVDGLLFMKRHYEGGFIYRELILVEAFSDETALAGWRIKYGYQDMNPGKPGVDVETRPPHEGETERRHRIRYPH